MTNNLRPLIPKNRKGMSAVITNLIIILLVIVAVGIIWTVVQGLIEEGTSQMDLSKFKVNARVSGVEIDDGIVSVQVENSGENDMPGVRIMGYSERGDTAFQVDRESSIPAKGIKTFDIEYSGIVTKVGVEPKVETEEGEIKNSGQVTGEKEISLEDIMEDQLGAVFWSKLDGNGNNELGGGQGVLEGNIDCEASGQFGRACEFSSTNDYVNVSSVNSLGAGQAYWVYNNSESEWSFYVNNSDDLYVDGQNVTSTDYSDVVSLNGGLKIGGNGAFTEGRVDEVIIFEKRLSDEVAESLMDLNLA